MKHVYLMSDAMSEMANAQWVRRQEHDVPEYLYEEELAELVDGLPDNAYIDDAAPLLSLLSAVFLDGPGTPPFLLIAAEVQWHDVAEQAKVRLFYYSYGEIAAQRQRTPAQMVTRKFSKEEAILALEEMPAWLVLKQQEAENGVQGEQVRPEEVPNGTH